VVPPKSRANQPQEPERVLLLEHGREALVEQLVEPAKVARLLKLLFELEV